MLSTLAISLPELTVQAAIVLGIAVVLLLFASWHRPKRIHRERYVGSKDAPVVVARIEPPLHKRPNPIRRLVSLALSGAMGVIIGAVVAILLAFIAAIIVSQLSSMLR